MLSIDHVLFPTDFSDGARRAFPQAAFLADWHDATLHILNVTGRHRHDYQAAKDQFPIPPHTLSAWMGRSPQDASGPAEGPDLSALPIVQEQIESARPAETILAYADDNDIDLVVMGTHGRRGVDRMLFGSVTEEVVRKVACPALTVRADAEAAPGQAVRRLLVPIDFSDASGVAIDHAKEIALTYGAEIDLLHVVDEPTFPAAYGDDLARFPTEEVLDRVETQLATMARNDIGYEHVQVAARTGSPAGVILDYIDEKDIDFVVIASHGRTGLDRMLLGSITERVLRRSPTPVFVVKPTQKSLVSGRPAATAASE
jgi:nucleotide-binding universal stress UspA family protein